MSKKKVTWEHLDVLWEHEEDAPCPEGAEIPSNVWEQIADLQYREHCRYMEHCNDFKNNPLTVI